MGFSFVRKKLRISAMPRSGPFFSASLLVRHGRYLRSVVRAQMPARVALGR
jgi:hypothetical protein